MSAAPSLQSDLSEGREELAPFSGRVTAKDRKRAGLLGTGRVVGPMITYYAGVTAPVIGAGVALLTSQSLRLAGMTPYWQTLLSAIFAAMAGVSWYLIFMRWSRPNSLETEAESEQVQSVRLTEDGVHIERDGIDLKVAWRMISAVKTTADTTILSFHSLNPVIIPHSWFQQGGGDRVTFHRLLQEGIERATAT